VVVAMVGQLLDGNGIGMFLRRYAPHEPVDAINLSDSG
jgi:hypothetical protein